MVPYKSIRKAYRISHTIYGNIETECEHIRFMIFINDKPCTFQEIWCKHIVNIHEVDILACGVLQSIIAGLANTLVFLVNNLDERAATRYFINQACTTICRTIIHDNNITVAICLLQQTFQSSSDVGPGIVDRDYDCVSGTLAIHDARWLWPLDFT